MASASERLASSWRRVTAVGRCCCSCRTRGSELCRNPLQWVGLLFPGSVVDVVQCPRVLGRLFPYVRQIKSSLVAASLCDSWGPCNAGFRVEHPQTFIDSVQYGQQDAEQVQRGRGRIPVADYRLATAIRSDAGVNPALASWGDAPGSQHGVTPRDEASAAPAERSVFSFCMCPGGPIACLPAIGTCTDPQPCADAQHSVCQTPMHLHSCTQVRSYQQAHQRMNSASTACRSGASDC